MREMVRAELAPRHGSRRSLPAAFRTTRLKKEARIADSPIRRRLSLVDTTVA